MSADLIFRFSLGPVQGFIAQARRTRDLWAGSFLLSWLTAKAMVNVRGQMRRRDPALKHYRILFPVVGDDPMIMALEKRGSEKPALATVPNQFKARVTTDFDAKAVGCAVKKAWTDLANEVFLQFVEAHAAPDTKGIWDSQIAGFWEINWVLGAETPEDNAGLWLAMRKNWRNHRQPDQGGEHCTLMGDWQEISGFDRVRNPDENRDFWDAMRQGKGKKEDYALDLREGERLCAIALVKRFFPKLPAGALKRTIGWVPDGDELKLAAWPSTGHVAATSWLKRAAEHDAVKTAAERFASVVKNDLNARHFSEQHPRIVAAKDAREKFGGDLNFASLDANFLRADDLGNQRAFQLYDKEGNLVNAEKRAELRKLHRELVEAMKKSPAKLGEPYPYYALLLMDGDKVGTLLGGTRDAEVSKALAQFTDKIKEAFDGKRDGLALYAGGDDVVALTTVEDAIPAARDLAQAYRDAFAATQVRTKTGEIPDISAAILFADHHEPFRDVMDMGHRLLNETAKHANGRASLAVAVQKPSGPAAQWVGKWRLDDGGEPPKIVAEIGKARPFSGRFPYKIKARYVDPAGDRFDHIDFTHADILRILERELAKSREGDTARRGTASAKIDDLPVKLATICRPPGTDTRVSEGTDHPIKGLAVGGLLLVRFLDQYGIWP